MTLPSQCPGCKASVPTPRTAGRLPFCSSECRAAHEVRKALMYAAMPRACESCGYAFRFPWERYTLNRLQRKTLDGSFCDQSCWAHEVSKDYP